MREKEREENLDVSQEEIVAESHLISIIIPVFNGESFIGRAIESVLQQTYTNYELIIINDGSTDKTADVCQKYADKYNNVYLRSIPNGGVSNARNLGIEISKGEYITFLDADDELMPDFLDYCLKSALETYADVVCINAYMQYANGSLNKLPPFIPSESIVENNEDKDKVIASLYINVYTKPEEYYYGQTIRTPWGKLFRANLIKTNNIQFPIGVSLGEDAIFNLYSFFYAKIISFKNAYLYKYCTAQQSATGTYKDNLYAIKYKEYNALHEALEKTNYSFKDVDLIFWLGYITESISNILKAHKSAIWKINKIHICLKSTYTWKINGIILGDFYFNTEKEKWLYQKNQISPLRRIKMKIKLWMILHHLYSLQAIYIYMQLSKLFHIVY